MKARWHWILLPSLLLSLGLLLASQIAFLRGGFFRDLRLGRMGTDFTLANYGRFFTDPLYLDSLILTVRLSLTVAILTLLVGFPIAYVLARLKSRWTLVLLAFAAPYAATWMGLNPDGVGADFSRTFVSFVLLFLIAWVLARARGIVSRAKAMVVVGVLLCLIVGANAVRDAQLSPAAATAPR